MVRGGLATILSEVLLAVTIFGAALWVFFGASRSSAFHVDESHYIFGARYFDLLFLKRDLGARAWGDNYWTHTQPMLTRYVVGAWLATRGYDLGQLPGPITDFRASRDDNLRRGFGPTDELLHETRGGMAGLAAAIVTLLYLIGRILFGVLAGVASAVLSLYSPLAQPTLVQVIPEAPLMLFVLLSLLLGILAIRVRNDGAISARWAIALGAALGLAVQAKLTAVLSVIAVMVFGVLAIALALSAVSARPAEPAWRRAWAIGRGWGLAVLVAAAVFVITNPHLYSNPIQHVLHMYELRAGEMLGQQYLLRDSALHTVPDRAAYVLAGSLIDFTVTGARGLLLEPVLAVAGAIALLARSLRSWQRKRILPAEALLGLTAGAYFIGISGAVLIAWPRYLIPTVLFGALLSGIGLAAICSQLYHGARALVSRPGATVEPASDP